MIPEVSIIIAAWNRKEDLRITLNALKKQTFKNHEVIIIDNNSTDGAKEMIKKEFPEVRIIALRKNVGASRARNIGINNSDGRTEYVWFLDSDAYPIKNSCLRDMISILKKNDSIGQLGGEIVDSQIRVPRSCRNQDGLFKFLEIGRAHV